MTILFVCLTHQAPGRGQAGGTKSRAAWAELMSPPIIPLRLATGWQLSITTQPQHKSLLFEPAQPRQPPSPPNNSLLEAAPGRPPELLKAGNKSISVSSTSSQRPLHSHINSQET